MAATETWAAIHTERKALLADLESLTDEQWRTPSLCGAWTVHDVLGHIVATAKTGPGRFFGSMIAAGFRFNTMVAKDVARQTAGSPADTLARFRDQLGATVHPPGPLEAMVGEAVIHGEDIRRPLGIKHEYAPDAVVRVAEFYQGSNLIVGAKKRISGLTLRATDSEWSHGTGPVVSGPTLALVLAMTGRPVALDDLTGDGVATLKTQM